MPNYKKYYLINVQWNNRMEAENLVQIIRDIKKYYGYCVYAAKSQLKAEVANSKLNWIWWILEPFCLMLVYSIVFGVIFNAAEPHQGLFIFVGLALWQFFSNVVKKSIVMIKRNKQIIGKVYMPKYMLIIQEILVSGFKMCICLAISVLLVVYYKVGITIDILLMIPLLLVLCLMSFGIGCFMLHFGVYLEDLSNIMDIFLRLLVYFVGVYFSIANRVRAPYNTLLIRWNPITFLVVSARKILIYHEALDMGALFFWFMLSLTVAYAGIQLIYKNENSYIKVV